MFSSSNAARSTLDATEEYVEVGLRSFGRGVFHKPAVPGVQLGNKKVYRIEPGDLVISNVFAWEGALAVASDSERGLIGSHRFMTWTPRRRRPRPCPVPVALLPVRTRLAPPP